MKIRELFEEKERTLLGSYLHNILIDVDTPNKKWNEQFDCSNRSLTSLKYCPKKIKGTFNCSYNNNLKSLEGMPQEGVLKLYAEECDLTSLEGAPKKISGDLNCANNKNLLTLKGAPQEGVRALFCDVCNLTSLEGAPLKINGSFIASDNPNLKSLKGLPKEGIHDLYLHNCDLTSLEGCPTVIHGEFACSDNKKLSSLKGMPQEGVSSVYVRGCNLTSLEGIPREIWGELICADNPITSLKGIHKIIDEIRDKIYLPVTIKSNILGLLKITSLRQIIFLSSDQHKNEDLEKIQAIINNYLPNPTSSEIIDCQNELIEAGFEEYAEL